ncbi:hypothetical protein C4900_01825 [Acidiferrobacter thiooxydans]|uniref:Uncharacterized protein n=1 Tax=Acidiferrobacter thiooxydans TaxID=163359 RepID=A0A368HGS9_9GAMM|nr:hypothetical protein C4900_01825 [Acidiferrobacter thiooxydans]
MRPREIIQVPAHAGRSVSLVHLPQRANRAQAAPVDAPIRGPARPTGRETFIHGMANPMARPGITIMVGGVVATPDDERDFQAEGGGERSQKTLAA